MVFDPEFGEIVAAHGNTLRALVKHIESIAEDQIAGLEIGTGEVYLYEIDEENGQIIAKDIKIAGGEGGCFLCPHEILGAPRRSKAEAPHGVLSLESLGGCSEIRYP